MRAKGRIFLKIALLMICGNICLWITVGNGAVVVRSRRSSSQVAFTLNNFTEANMELVLRQHLLDRNEVTLACQNISIRSTFRAEFWLVRDDNYSIAQELIPVDSFGLFSGEEITFTLRPEFEGYFFCGNISSMIRSRNNLPLLAFPIQQEPFVDCDSVRLGESVTLMCPFMQGTLHQYYVFSWWHNFSRVFSSRIENQHEFVVNHNNFSLTISNASYHHSGIYRCQVIIDNPLGNTFISPDVPIVLYVNGENSSSSECIRSSSVTSFSTFSLQTVSPSPSLIQLTINRTDSRGFPRLISIVIAVISAMVSVACIFIGIMAVYRYRNKSTPSQSTHIERGLNSGLEVMVTQPDGRCFDRSCNSISSLNGCSRSDALSSVSPNISSNPSSTCLSEAQSQALSNDSTANRRSSESASQSISSATPTTDPPMSSTILARSTIASSSLTTLIADTYQQSLQRGTTCSSLRSVESEPSRPTTPAEVTCTSLVSSTEAHRIPSSNQVRDPPSVLSLQKNMSHLVSSSNTAPTPGSRQQPPSFSSMASPSHTAIGLVTSPISLGSITRDRSIPSQTADTLYMLEPIEDYKDDSNDFVFIGSTQVITCGPMGGKYEVPEQGILIRIPPIALDIFYSIEVGVAMHGLFKFPADRRPISAILWLKVRNEPANFTFKKPVEVCLPHFLGLTNEDIDNADEHWLGYISSNELMDRQKNLIFTEGSQENVQYKQKNATIKTDHFCFICLTAKTSIILEKSQYLLTQILPDPITTLQWDIHFFISYNLDSFLKMIKDLYTAHKVKFTTTPFQFMHSAAADGRESIKINISYQSSRPVWKIAFQNDKQVKKSSIHEIWEKDVSVLQAKLKLKAYPPRIIAIVSGASAFENITATVTFEGTCDEGGLSREVHFVLPQDYVDQNQERLQFLHSRSLPVSESTQPNSMEIVQRSLSTPQNVVVIPEEPTSTELVQVVKKILGKFPSWPILIQTLGIPDDKSAEILQETKYVRIQILRMLNTWIELHRHDASCTRKNLAAILRLTDDSLISAAKILESPRHH